MRKFSILFFLFLFSVNIHSQEKFDPSILILQPAKIEVDRDNDREYRRIRTGINFIKRYLQRHLPDPDEEVEENLQIMVKNKNEIISKLNIKDYFSLVIRTDLENTISDVFPDFLVLQSRNKSTEDVEKLENIAENQQVRYVFSIPNINISDKNDIKEVVYTVLLYDNKSKEILTYQKYYGTDNKEDSQAFCTESSIACVVENAVALIVEDLIFVFGENSPYIAQILETDSNRNKKIDGLLGSTSTSLNSSDIISNYKTDLKTGSIYYEIFSPDSSKFISFLGEKNKAKKISEVKEFYSSSTKIIGETEVFGIEKLPNTFAHIISGVKQDGDWHLSSSKNSIFNSESIDQGVLNYTYETLKNLSFFKDNSDSINTVFWEMGLFELIKDITKTEEYKKNPEKFEIEMLRDRDYIGDFRLVANLKREELKEKYRLFEERIEYKYLTPYFESLKNNPDVELDSYLKLNNYEIHFIYSSDSTYVIFPLGVSLNFDSTIHLRFYLFDTSTQQLYSWTYFDPIEVKSGFYGEEVYELMSSITEWNFEFQTLDNPVFWNDYVFKKENDQFLYIGAFSFE